MSAAGHADTGNVTQDDDTQADDDYDGGLDDGHQTDTDSKVRAESIRALRRADQIVAVGRSAKQLVSGGRRGKMWQRGGGESQQVPQEDLEVSQPSLRGFRRRIRRQVHPHCQGGRGAGG